MWGAGAKPRPPEAEEVSKGDHPLWQVQGSALLGLGKAQRNPRNPSPLNTEKSSGEELYKSELTFRRGVERAGNQRRRREEKSPAEIFPRSAGGANSFVAAESYASSCSPQRLAENLSANLTNPTPQRARLGFCVSIPVSPGSSRWDRDSAESLWSAGRKRRAPDVGLTLGRVMLDFMFFPARFLVRARGDGLTHGYTAGFLRGIRGFRW